MDITKLHLLVSSDSLSDSNVSGFAYVTLFPARRDSTSLKHCKWRGSSKDFGWLRVLDRMVRRSIRDFDCVMGYIFSCIMGMEGEVASSDCFIVGLSRVGKS